jgi:RND superfamily putative drug exporter
MYERVAQFVTRRPRAILVITFLLVLLALGYAFNATDSLRTGGFAAPGADSTRAAQMLADNFAVGQPNVVLLVRGDRAVEDPAVAAEGLRLTRQFAAEPQIEAVTSHWQTGDRSLRARDGRSALVVGRIKVRRPRPNGSSRGSARVTGGRTDRWRC